MSSFEQDMLAVDVGSSRVKFGWFAGGAACSTPPPTSGLPIAASSLPEPAEMFACWHRGVPAAEVTDKVAAWLETLSVAQPRVVLASVHAKAAELISDIVVQLGLATPTVLQAQDLPLQLSLTPPQFAGIDRLLNAVAVNRLRKSDHPAIAIDIGSACTVDLVDPQGVFQGGAIAPGISLAGASLRAGTFSLPEIRADTLQLPAGGVGKCTVEAISAGIYWGMIGTIATLVEQYRQSLGTQPQLFLTGGDAPLVLSDLEKRCGTVRHIPYLLLAGIAVACQTGAES